MCARSQLTVKVNSLQASGHGSPVSYWMWMLAAVTFHPRLSFTGWILDSEFTLITSIANSNSMKKDASRETGCFVTLSHSLFHAAFAKLAELSLH